MINTYETTTYVFLGFERRDRQRISPRLIVPPRNIVPTLGVLVVALRLLNNIESSVGRIPTWMPGIGSAEIIGLRRDDRTGVRYGLT